MNNSVRVLTVSGYVKLYSDIFEKIPEDVTVPDDVVETVNHVMEVVKLSERDIDFIRLRYGLEDGICRTYWQIGKLFNMTGEAVRHYLYKSIYELGKVKYYREMLKAGKLEYQYEGDHDDIVFAECYEDYERAAAYFKECDVQILGFPKRIENALKRGGLKTVFDVICVKDKQLKKIRCIGVKSYEEINNRIEGLLNVHNLKRDEFQRRYKKII